MRHKSKTFVLALLLIFIFACWSKIVFAQEPLIQGTGFKLLFNKGDTLCIQGKNSFVSLLVLDGVWNGTDCYLFVNREDAGQLNFVSLDACVLRVSASPEVQISIDGVPYANNTAYLEEGKTVTMTWNTALKIWMPIMLVLGLSGIGMLVIAPVYFIGKIKSRDWSDAFCWGFLMFIIGIALIITWLWS